MKNVLKILSVIVLSIFMFSCEGEDGAVGPQGEQGTQGEQGPQGDTGTANVIYSDWVDSGFPDNITTASEGFTIQETRITEEIKNSGTVLVYAKTRITEGFVYQIPATVIGKSYSFLLDDGALTILVASVDGSNVGITLFGSYRYVLIPGGVPAGKNVHAIDYTKMSYEEITALFNIPE